MPEDYRHSLTGMSLLKNDAVPSVFYWSKSPKPRTGKATKRCYAQALSSSNVEDPEEAQLTESIDSIPELTMLMDSPSKNIKSLEEELKAKDDLLRAKDQTIATLKAQLSLSKFGVDRFGTDNSLINLYTGFTNYTALKAIFDYLAPSASHHCNPVTADPALECSSYDAFSVSNSVHLSSGNLFPKQSLLVDILFLKVQMEVLCLDSMDRSD